MRRTLVLALTALALLGVVTPEAYAQAPATAPGAPAPTFKITGFIDELMTYSRNVSVVDADLHRIDTIWYGRTRGRFDIIGEYGKAKGVLGLEMDLNDIPLGQRCSFSRVGRRAFTTSARGKS